MAVTQLTPTARNDVVTLYHQGNTFKTSSPSSIATIGSTSNPFANQRLTLNQPYYPNYDLVSLYVPNVTSDINGSAAKLRPAGRMTSDLFVNEPDAGDLPGAYVVNAGYLTWTGGPYLKLKSWNASSNSTQYDNEYPFLFVGAAQQVTSGTPVDSKAIEVIYKMQVPHTGAFSIGTTAGPGDTRPCTNNSTYAPKSNKPSWLWACTHGTFSNTGTNTSTIESPTWVAPSTVDEQTEVGIVLATSGNSYNSPWAVKYVTLYASEGAALPNTPVSAGSGYGMVLYNDSGLVTFSTARGDRFLRELYSGTASNGTTVTATGMTRGNSVILQNVPSAGSTLGGGKSRAAFYNNGNQAKFASAALNSGTTYYSLVQFAGAANPNSYGIEVENYNGENVLDENVYTFGVNRVISVSSSGWSSSVGGLDYKTFNITGIDPFTAPAIGLKSGGSDRLYAPTISYVNGTTMKITVYREAGVTNSFSVALLTNVAQAGPTGTKNYGIQLFDSGSVVYDSSWRQAVVTGVVDIGGSFFSGGTGNSQGNGAYDLRSGYDGVKAPTATSGTGSALSTGGVKKNITLSSQDSLNPANTYVIFNACSGFVEYYKGYDTQSGNYAGGGQHSISVRINGSTSFSLQMARVGPGITPTSSSQWGTRKSSSVRPEGHILLARIEDA
jgi:hypothetical protein